MNIKNSLLALLVTLTGATYAQENPYAKYIDTKDLNKHLSILASDEYEGRETGKAGQKKAAAYLTNEFQKMGLLPVNGQDYQQSYKLYEKILSKRSLVVNQKNFEIGDQFNPSKDKLQIQVQSNEIYFVGYGIKEEKYNSFNGIDVEGKVIVVMLGEPKIGETYLLSGTKEESLWSNRRKKISELKKLKPALIILVDDTYEKYAKYYKHQLESSGLSLAYKYTESTDASVLTVSKDVADELLKPNKKTFDKLTKKLPIKKVADKPLKLKSTVNANIEFVLQDVYAENVLAMVPGTDKKDEYIFITAHYDHIGMSDGNIYNGADDDGSGTVALLEIAQAFSMAQKEGKGPRRSIVFMAVSGEEKGLLGSEYYTDHAIIPLEKTVCDLNIDMIGRIDEDHKNDTNYVYVIGSDKLSSELHTINENANKYVNMTLDYKYNDPKDPNMFYYRSDHYNFAKHSVPIIFYFNGVHEDYHKEGDEVSKIHFPMLAKRTTLPFYTAWELANREQRIIVDKKNDFPTSK